MSNKQVSRLRRARKTRAKIATIGKMRLTIFKTPKHIYAQLFTSDGSQTITSASTVDKDLQSQLQSTGNQTAAELVGKTIAERCIEKGVSEIAFDRSGYKYHGRVKKLADAARTAGLNF